MRIIEKNMINAIRNRRNWKDGNTRVEVSESERYVKVYLHGNAIMNYSYATGTLYLSECGWNTATTRSRLTAIIGAFTSYISGIRCCKGIIGTQYADGRFRPWCGETATFRFPARAA